VKHFRTLASKHSTREGSTIPLFAVLLFALIPLMSLIVHVGMITLTRRQMQTAINTAALEALRFRDEESMTEVQRRDQVADLVANIFDDDLNPGNGQGTSRLGIGPDVELNDGIALPGTDFRASTTIAGANAYQPVRLESNLNDEVPGDMLAGQYLPADSLHDENGSYERTDFDSESGNDAFLVRMRRSGETAFGAGVGSAGPPVPHLFGRGPFGNLDWMDRIERGTIARATAIAQARPVVVVGPPNDNLNLGLALFWLELESWTALPIDEAQSVTLNSNGTIVGQAMGNFIEREVAVLGMELLPASPPGDLEIGESRWVAIYADIDGTNRIIGFGQVILESDVSGFSITKRRSRIATRNAAAQFVISSPATGQDWIDVWKAHRSFTDQLVPNANEPLLAPALVRTMR
jgi:hypothetical protein